jgi:amidase
MDTTLDMRIDVPMQGDGRRSALWQLSACEAGDLLAGGEVSPSEMLANVAERVAAVNPAVNALPTLCLERAAESARRCETLAKGERGPLQGLPVPIKDSYEVAGVRTTYGSLAYAEHVPDRSDYLVEAMERRGAVIFAKSNTPEFEAGANTFNEVFGRTLNPWNTSRSAAGSSGGAAVAVATGMAHVAQGSDFACSLRYPAAFCNVVGLRPSPGLIPQGPSKLPHQVLSVIGPLARSVADVGFALDGMAAFDARDPLTRPAGPASFRMAAERPERPPRAAFSPDLGFATVSKAVAEQVRAAITRLSKAGLDIAEPVIDLRESDPCFRVLRAGQFAAMRRDAFVHHRHKLKPEVAWNIEEGLKLSLLQLAEAEAQRARLRSDMLAILDRHGFIIAPTAPVTPFPVEERYVKVIDGFEQSTYLDWLALGYAITVTGCPAISIPCGPGIGLQIVGKPYEEESLLSFASWVEEVLGSRLVQPISPRAPVVQA